MRTLFIGATAVALTIIPGAPAAQADISHAPNTVALERPPDTERRSGGLLARLFPPARLTSSGCTIKWGGGLSEGRFMVRRVTSC
jgi:hypothetical protein